MTNEEMAAANDTTEAVAETTIDTPTADATEATESSAKASSPISEESKPTAEQATPPEATATDSAPSKSEAVKPEEPATEPAEPEAGDAAAESVEATTVEATTVEATTVEATTAEATTAEATTAEATPPETAATAPESKSEEPSTEAAASSAAVVEEGPTTPNQVPTEPLSLEELAKQSPALAPAVEAHQNKTPITGKVIGWNKGGFHVALAGVPAFCPKSQMEIGNPKRAHAYVDRDLQFTVAEIRENGKRIVVHRKSLLRAQRQDVIQSLKDRSSSGEPISGKVTSVTDFGAFVDLGGIEGLVHLSQLSRQRVEKPSDAVKVGQEVAVKVLKVEKGGDRISLSMKALEPDPWKDADENFEIGDTFTGKVVRATDFGLFVDVGNGMEGLLHSSQLEIKKSMADYPEGSDVTGWIREVDGGRRRISLSLREVAKGNPWKDLGTRYEEGQQIEGTIEQVAKFGVFVLLEPGLSGLLPFSATRPEGGGGSMLPQRRYNPGDSINVQIDAIDPKRKRISLAPIGSKLEGTKADLRDFQKTAAPTGGLSAMAAAFAKLQGS